jgi:probable selenium-dependent hydroxylase accessory protein YqeC
MQIQKALNLAPPAVLAIIGCGGKTSLIKLLAASWPDKKILISPTTKMSPLHIQNVDCRGVYNEKTGKLESLSPEKLAELIPNYDISLLEADGSRGLPCKGWLETEPVIPEYSTHTIAVVPITVLGKSATAEYVHNLPLFLELTGLKEGQPITEKALQNMILSPGGMFKNSAGKRVLLINQAEEKSAKKSAEQLCRQIKQNHPKFFCKLIYGSVFNDVWVEV